MLRFILAFFLSLLSISAQAQGLHHVEYPKTWINELVENPYATHVWLKHGLPPSGIDANFHGNPFAVINSINTAGGIVTSRDADLSGCKSPCFIQVSSRAITSPDTTRPYEDISCSWDFGDPAGTERIVRPTDGVTVNPNTDQTGCDAVYPYRVAGPYTITLTLKGSNGNCNSTGRCAVTTATVTKNITVTTFSATGGEYWYDSNYVCGVPNPCTGTLAGPFNSPSNFATGNTLLNSGDNVALHVKCSSDFTVPQGWELFPGADRTGIRIDPYGTLPCATMPIIAVDGSSTRLPLGVGGGNGAPTVNVSDIVVSGIKFLNKGFAGGVVSVGNRRNGAAAGGTTTNVYLDNVWMEATVSNAPVGILAAGGAGGGQTTPLIEEGTRFGCWKCTFKNPLTSTHLGIAHVGSAATWDFTVGGSFEGAGTSRTFDHHFYPDTRENFVVQWVTFGTTGNSIANGKVNGQGGSSGGSGYTNGTYNNVPLTGGSGTGILATVTVSGGAVTAVDLVFSGTGYVTGDLLSANAANIGGTGSGFIFYAENGNTRNFALNGNWDGIVSDFNDHQIAQFYTVHQNYFMGTAVGGTDHTIDLGNRSNNTAPVSITAAQISGTTLTVNTCPACVAPSLLAAGPAGVGSSLINTFAGGTLINGTRIIGSASVSPGLCTPNCTGAGSTGTYAVDTSQTVASQAMYSADSTVFFDNVVLSENGENGFTGGSMLWGNGRTVTIRDHRVWGGSGEWWRPAIDQIPGYTQYQNAAYNIYRNHLSMSSGGSFCMICYNVGKTWTTKQVVGYNIVGDGRSTPKFEEFVWADFLADASVWDYNTWSVMGGGNTTPWVDTSTAKNFSNWQNAGSTPARWGAHDTNLGATVPSGWSNPPTSWGQMNFLLKRDIDPASNDNDPMWLAKAA
jgi:hypothetical protein